MSETARKPASYSDLLALPPGVVGEILGGELHASPRPAAPHAMASSELGFSLGPPFRRGSGGPGGWWILYEPELHLGADVLVPDLAGWRRQRMPYPPREAAFTMAPDWVCEVLSPSTCITDRAVKMPIYAREGVAHLWLLDPLVRTLEVFRLQDGLWVLLGVHIGNATVRAEPFDAVPLSLTPLWGGED